jgi:hypothetical protein
MIVRAPNVRFAVGRARDVVAMAAELDDDVDVVVSFEVIEHLSAEERAVFLEGAHSVLAPRGGSLVLSTPNGARRRGHRPNPFHEHELTADELRSELRSAGFVEVRIQGLYLQPPWPHRLEHVAATVPFRAVFRRLARAGRYRPDACRTLLCACRAT